MNGKHVGTALAALVAATALAAPALAQNEQFIPHLVYRTGAYAPNGIPVANGIADYYTLINQRDRGDSPYGKEPIALLQKRAQMHGFD
jgi:hypothetical protein